MRAKVMTGLNKVAAHLATISSVSGSSSMVPPSQPLSDVMSTVAGVMGQRERLRAGVFLPGHELPTMTVEEFGELELQQMRAREQQQQQLEAEAKAHQGDINPREYDEYDEEAVEKQRAWDDWKDSNRKGHGNSALRPCGR